MSVSVPTLIVYGELDKGLGERGARLLSNIPHSKTVVIPGGKHPCYLDNPDLFHSSILQFMHQYHNERRT